MKILLLQRHVFFPPSFSARALRASAALQPCHCNKPPRPQFHLLGRKASLASHGTHQPCVVPHGGVILFDETANLKPGFLQTCYNLLSKEYGNIPIVLCSNKVDVNHLMMMGDKNIGLKMENNITLPYFKIPANNNHNLEAPFLYLAKRLTENDELLFDKPQPPVLNPPHIPMHVTAAQHGPESGPAAAQPFPVEDNNGCCCACLKPLVECLKACYYMVSIWDAFMNWVEEA